MSTEKRDLGDGRIAIIKTETDIYPLLADMYGEYVGKWSEGCITRQNPGRGEFEFFMPSSPEFGQEAYERMESFNRGEWYAEVISIVVDWQGIKGEASCFGVESDCSPEYREELVGDLIGQASGELDKEIKRLRSVLGGQA